MEETIPFLFSGRTDQHRIFDEGVHIGFRSFTKRFLKGSKQVHCVVIDIHNALVMNDAKNGVVWNQNFVVVQFKTSTCRLFSLVGFIFYVTNKFNQIIVQSKAVRTVGKEATFSIELNLL